MDTHQPLHGRLEDVHFSELLLTISQRKESGVLHVMRHKIEKDVYFNDGRIVFAKSNDPDERLGELCLRTGKISFRHLDLFGLTVNQLLPLTALKKYAAGHCWLVQFLCGDLVDRVR